MNSDHFSTIATLESALAAEKASHTQTLAELALVKEALESAKAIAEQRKRDSVEAEQVLYKIAMSILGTDSVPGDYERLLDECAMKIDQGHEALGFIKEHGDEVLFLLGDGAGDGPGARIHDELETLMMAIDLTACFDVGVDDDEPTEPMATGPREQMRQAAERVAEWPPEKRETHEMASKLEAYVEQRGRRSTERELLTGESVQAARTSGSDVKPSIRVASWHFEPFEGRVVRDYDEIGLPCQVIRRNLAVEFDVINEQPGDIADFVGYLRVCAERFSR
jgi:hypothetical protein